MGIDFYTSYLCYSNTTFVKVKWGEDPLCEISDFDSNTTFVKVKYKVNL